MHSNLKQGMQYSHNLNLLVTQPICFLLIHCFFYDPGIQKYSLYTCAASEPSTYLPWLNRLQSLKSAIAVASVISRKLALLHENYKSGGHFTQNDIKHDTTVIWFPRHILNV